jgi:hypothetical protein
MSEWKGKLAVSSIKFSSRQKFEEFAVFFRRGTKK